MTAPTGANASKIVSLPEAVLILEDGASLAIGGDMTMAPLTLVRETIRSGRKELRLVCVGSAAIGADLLIGAGAVSGVEFSQISLGEYGAAPHFRRRFEAGTIAGREHACPTLIAALQAAASGIPFLPVRGLLGTDYMNRRGDFRTIVNPYDDNERIAVVPALRPDVAFLHAYAADPLGNALAHPAHNGRLLAQAARRTIVSAERIVTPEELLAERARGGAFVPSLYVTAVVEAPYGAHPAACPGSYPLDAGHVREYVDASRSNESFAAYLRRYAGAEGESAYRRLIRTREEAS
ncbi:MAG: CoA transferase subunit A [Paenibacillaceae bacterium]|nr:CoA transferase subunit A [Paenibacillaceae bacterium]